MAVTAPTPIDNLPPPPDPNDRSTFNSRAYPWSLAQQTLATQANALAQNVYGNAQDAESSATAANTAKGLAQTAVTDAQAQVTLAQGYANEALGHAADAANAAYSVASQWAPGAYTANQVVWLNVSSGSLYRCTTDVNSSTAPNLDSAHWVYVGPAPEPLPASVIYTYTGGLVTKINSDGEETTITYNVDGTVNTIAYPYNSKTRTEAYSYTNGTLTSVTSTEI